MANIAIYKHHPYCSEDSAIGVSTALQDSHVITFFDEEAIDTDWLKQFDMVVFPGGIGDADIFDQILSDRSQIITDYVINGGKYLGICMGAYWAGSRYFNIMHDVEVVQYIKKPDALVRRSYGTVINCEWLGEDEVMYFYDGCTYDGNLPDTEIIGRYGQSDDPNYPMAIIQGNVGLIGTHPESQEYWYDTWSYMLGSWHDGGHHELLLNFVNRLLVS